MIFPVVQSYTDTGSLIKWILIEILRISLALLLLRWLRGSSILQRSQIPLIQIGRRFSVNCLLSVRIITMLRAVASVYQRLIVLPKLAFAVIHVLREILSVIAKIRCFSDTLVNRPRTVQSDVLNRCAFRIVLRESFESLLASISSRVSVRLNIIINQRLPLPEGGQTFKKFSIVVFPVIQRVLYFLPYLLLEPLVKGFSTTGKTYLVIFYTLIFLVFCLEVCWIVWLVKWFRVWNWYLVFCIWNPSVYFSIVVPDVFWNWDMSVHEIVFQRFIFIGFLSDRWQSWFDIGTWFGYQFLIIFDVCIKVAACVFIGAIYWAPLKSEFRNWSQGWQLLPLTDAHILIRV